MHKMLKSRSGFTLLELLITTVVVGIVAAMAVPRFQTAWERQKFRGGNNDIVSKIKMARSYAISSKSPYGIYFDEQSNSFTVFKDVVNLSTPVYDDGDSVIVTDTLPEEFDYIYTDCENSVIMFNSNGSASFDGGGYIMASAYTEHTYAMSMINVLASTGRVRVQSYYY